jgi:hypothetical protein
MTDVRPSGLTNHRDTLQNRVRQHVRTTTEQHVLRFFLTVLDWELQTTVFALLEVPVMRNVQQMHAAVLRKL